MAPPAFNDFGADCDNLFNEHHSQGSVSYSHKGKMGCGADYSLNLKNDNGSKDVNWDFTAMCHNMEVSYDHSNTISKKLAFDVKQVPGLAAEYNCSFNTASGLDLGDINFNYSNEKANINIKSNLSASPKINFDASVDTKFQDHVVGVAGRFDAGNGAMGPVALGVHRAMGNTQCSWKADDITNPCVGTGSIFVKTPENKDFCCYGIQVTTGDEAKLSLAAASSCCKNSMRYKLDHDGSFHVAKVNKLSQTMSLNLSSSLNLKNLSSGNHKFGAGLSWE
jgi:hypothetical protein